MTDDTPYVSITRTFATSPEEVWRAWTSPAQFGHWFGTAATTVDDVEMDVRVGGTWRARMILPDGAEIGWHGSYLEVDAPHRLVLSLSDRPGDQFERVTVALAKVDGGTEMTFTQSGGHVPPEQHAQLEEGWRSFFDDLAKELSDSSPG
ncbi:MAG TPA: SRPBCC domain-containing protein [Acidimicrobiales bacterium]|nr:SRPBCC domain-containing protein [Acidimicrobiales bacterium]